MLSPWQTYYNMIDALFGQDPEVELEFDPHEKVITVRVEDGEKAEALAKILPFEREFGDVTVRTRIVPANGDPIGAEVVEAAFRGNPVFSQLIAVDSDDAPFSLSYCMFVKEVAQFWNDNLGDPHGNLSALYADLADEVLDVPGVLFSTEE